MRRIRTNYSAPAQRGAATRAVVISSEAERSLTVKISSLRSQAVRDVSTALDRTKEPTPRLTTSITDLDVKLATAAFFYAP